MYWYNKELEWDPFGEMRRLQRQMNRLFDVYGPGAEAYPAVNVWSKGDEIVLTAEIPGVDPKDLDISVRGDQVTLQGERKADAATEDVVCRRAERGTGRFVRTLRLPFEVESGKVAAKCRHGVLTVTLPRAEASKPRKIEIAKA